MSEEGMAAEPSLAITPDETPVQNTIASNESRPVETPMDSVQPKQAQELLAGKFKTQDDLINSYKELEAKLGNYRQETAKSTIDEIVAATGFDGADLAANFNADGKLSDDQYAAFEKVGFSKDVVDTFLRGQQAIAQNSVYAQERIKANAIKMAGGEEQLNGLFRWAANNLPEARTADLNARLASPTEYESAMKELLFDYQLQSGRLTNQNEILSGQAMPNMSRGFESSQEMIAALKQAEQQGYYDESFKRRMANTPKHIITGAGG